MWAVEKVSAESPNSFKDVGAGVWERMVILLSFFTKSLCVSQSIYQEAYLQSELELICLITDALREFRLGVDELQPNITAVGQESWTLVLPL